MANWPSYITEIMKFFEKLARCDNGNTISFLTCEHGHK